jgi:hypothetical protein
VPAVTPREALRVPMPRKEVLRAETAMAEGVGMEQGKKVKSRYEAGRDEQVAMALVGAALVERALVGTAGPPRLLPGEPSARAQVMAARPRQTARPVSVSTEARRRVVRGALYCWTLAWSRMSATP